MRARALIFHMSIPCDKTFPLVPLFFTLWPWPWSMTHFTKNFNLTNNSRTVTLRALIFHMSIPCDKTFRWVPSFFTLWPWPWSMTHFLKILNLQITFEQWVLEFWYFTWVFLVIRPFHAHHYVWPCNLYLKVWPTFLKLRSRLSNSECYSFDI